MERLILPAVPESLAPLKDHVLRLVRDRHPGPAACAKLDLVLEEILVNIVQYAYPDGPGKVEVGCRLENESVLWVEIVDWGRPFDPLAVTPPVLDADLASRPVGGLGIFLVRSLVEDLEYRRDGDRNLLSFLFRLGA